MELPKELIVELFSRLSIDDRFNLCLATRIDYPVELIIALQLEWKRGVDRSLYDLSDLSRILIGTDY